jgi:plastocyanin
MLAAITVFSLAVSIGLTAGNAHGGTAAASFTASDPSSWHLTGDPGTNSVHIDPGQTVFFEYPTGSNQHNADFGSRPPTSCQQTGNPSAVVPPLPNSASPPGWSGTCTFMTEQTYTFFCDKHGNGMRGTIIVGNGGPSGGGGPTTPGGGTPGSTNSLKGDALRVSKSQHSTRARGSALIGIADSKLTVEVFATSKSLDASAAKLVRVGRTIKRSLKTGRVKFSVRINSAALTALKASDRLRLTLKAKLTSPADVTVKATRRLKLKV